MDDLTFAQICAKCALVVLCLVGAWLISVLLRDWFSSPATGAQTTEPDHAEAAFSMESVINAAIAASGVSGWGCSRQDASWCLLPVCVATELIVVQPDDDARVALLLGECTTQNGYWHALLLGLNYRSGLERLGGEVIERPELSVVTFSLDTFDVNGLVGLLKSLAYAQFVKQAAGMGMEIQVDPGWR